MNIQPVEQTRYQIGPCQPHNPPRHTVYVGRDQELKGKGALVGYAWGGGVCVAQFDDVDTGFGYGWHHFRNDDFMFGEH